MPQKNSDLDLLIKMLGMTGSDNENQVLIAIRKANEQVKKLAGSWEQLLRGHFTIAADPFTGLDMPTTTFKQAPAFHQPTPQPTPQSRQSQAWTRVKPAPKPRKQDISQKPVKDILDSLGL
jgi:hypothetical protein